MPTAGNAPALIPKVQATCPDVHGQTVAFIIRVALFYTFSWAVGCLTALNCEIPRTRTRKEPWRMADLNCPSVIETWSIVLADVILVFVLACLYRIFRLYAPYGRAFTCLLLYIVNYSCSMATERHIKSHTCYSFPRYRLSISYWQPHTPRMRPNNGVYPAFSATAIYLWYFQPLRLHSPPLFRSWRWGITLRLRCL